MIGTPGTRRLAKDRPVVMMLFDVKNISRARGSSAVSSAAYIARTKLADERLHRSFDFRARGGLVHSEILLPEKAPAEAREWAGDRATLWNRAEKAEIRADARVAREYVVALPTELTDQQRLDLARGFAQSIADRYSVAADLAVHRAPPGGDPRNHHAHVLATTRVIQGDSLGAKTDLALPETQRRERGLVSSKEEIRQLRVAWADRLNAQLRDAGLDLSVDPRSYWERGINQVPQPHLGPRITALERAGVRTEVGTRLREEHAARVRMMSEFAAAQARSQHPVATAVPAEPVLEASQRELKPQHSADAAETAGPAVALTIDERQRRAAERWLAYRQEREAGKQAGARAAKANDHDLGADLEM